MYPLTISMQTHTYVHLTQDMSTHKFECPTEVVTLDKGNCGKPAHIYVNDLCDIKTIEYHIYTHKYVCLTYKTWTHICEWPATILMHCNTNHGQSAHIGTAS